MIYTIACSFPQFKRWHQLANVTERIMSGEHTSESKDETSYIGWGMPLGLLIGGILGLVLGILTGNVPLWLILGAGGGMTVGLAASSAIAE